MAYIIISDTACDLPPQLTLEMGVRYQPFNYFINGKKYTNYFDERELKCKDLFTMLKEDVQIETKPLEVAQTKDFFRKFLSKKLDIFCITVSSSLSETFNNISIAARELELEFPERTISVVDSLSTSAGLGLLVYLAARNRDEKMSLRDNVDYIEIQKNRVRHWVTLNNVSLIGKSNRLDDFGSVGKLFNLKPIIKVNDEGYLEVISKKMSKAKAVKEIINDCVENVDDFTGAPTFVAYSGTSPNEANELVKELKSKYKELGITSEIYLTRFSPVHSIYLDEDAIGVFNLGDKR